MATYKVLQDIEAEDKLLGPLTLRQFIYASIVVVQLFIAFKLATVQILYAIPFLPTLIFFGALAAPFGKDQSSEVWMLAKIRYFMFPRRRIWDQSGLKDLVTITAPKVIEKHYTKDFDREEAVSRLKALAQTMDTRGWVIKNVSPSGYANTMLGQPSDRLLELQQLPQDDNIAAVKASEDVLDSNDTPLAQQIRTMVADNQQTHRQAMLQNMQELAEAQRNQAPATSAPPAVATSQPASPSPIVAPASGTSTTDDNTQAITRARKAISNLSSVDALEEPTASNKPYSVPPVSGTGGQTTRSNSGIINSVAKPVKPSELDVQSHIDDDGSSSGEVVISLH